MRIDARTVASRVAAALAKGVSLVARFLRNYVEAHARRVEYEVDLHRRLAAHDGNDLKARS